MRIPAALIWAAAVTTASSQIACADQLCEREIMPFAAMKAAIEADPGAKVVRETAEWVEIVDEKRRAIWTLTKPGDTRPAAYICRKIVEEDGQVKIRLTAQCSGPKPVCDSVIRQVLAEQERATAHLRDR